MSDFPAGPTQWNKENRDDFKEIEHRQTLLHCIVPMHSMKLLFKSYHSSSMVASASLDRLGCCFCFFLISDQTFSGATLHRFIVLKRLWRVKSLQA